MKLAQKTPFLQAVASPEVSPESAMRLKVGASERRIPVPPPLPAPQVAVAAVELARLHEALSRATRELEQQSHRTLGHAKRASRWRAFAIVTALSAMALGGALVHSTGHDRALLALFGK